MEDSRAKYMTIDAFRRGYFVDGSRPTRAQVRGWIDAGTLPAIRLDGRLYVREDNADAFLRGAQARDHEVERARAWVKDRREKQERARASLRRFGFDV